MKRKRTARSALSLMELVVVLTILVALATILVPLIATTATDAQFTTTNATMKSLRDAIIAYNRDMKGIQVWPGTVPGTTGIPLTLKDLQIRPMDGSGVNQVPLYNPATRIGWRGPYLLQATGSFSPLATSTTAGLNASFYPSTGIPYGSAGDPAFLDGWSNPIVLQWPQSQNGDPTSVFAPYVRLVSAGPPVPMTVNGATTLQGNLVTPSSTVGNVVPYQYFPLTSQRGKNLVLFIFVQDPYP